MQFKIPQDVQRQDKIVGPLTLKQLIIVTIGGTMAYVLYTTLSKQYLIEVWLLPVLFVSALTAAIAFLKIHGIPFLLFCLLYAERKLKPQSRTWQKMAGDVFIFSFGIEGILHGDDSTGDDTTSQEEHFRKLEELTKMVDHDPLRQKNHVESI